MQILPWWSRRLLLCLYCCVFAKFYGQWNDADDDDDDDDYNDGGDCYYRCCCCYFLSLFWCRIPAIRRIWTWAWRQRIQWAICHVAKASLNATTSYYQFSHFRPQPSLQSTVINTQNKGKLGFSSLSLNWRLFENQQMYTVWNMFPFIVLEIRGTPPKGRRHATGTAHGNGVSLSLLSERIQKLERSPDRNPDRPTRDRTVEAGPRHTTKSDNDDFAGCVKNVGAGSVSNEVK